MFPAQLLDLDFHPGAESLDARLFAAPEIPWDGLACPVVKETLGLYFQDRAAGREGLRVGDIVREDGEMRGYRVTIFEE